MNTSQNKNLPKFAATLSLCASALAAGCSHSGDSARDDNKKAVQKQAPPAATAPAPIPPVPAPPVEPLSPTIKRPKTISYSVSIMMADKAIVTVADKSGHYTLTVKNTGPDIPALSLWFNGDGSHCTIGDARSDRIAHPDPVMVDSGQGWDFGPLKHGKSTQITLHLETKKPGIGELIVKPYAIAEDEGDTQRTIDAPIEGAERKLTVQVLAAQPVS